MRDDRCAMIGDHDQFEPIVEAGDRDVRAGLVPGGFVPGILRRAGCQTMSR
jgi:hypothetical protein